MNGRDPALVAEWEKENIEPKENKKGQWESIYQLQVKWDKGATAY